MNGGAGANGGYGSNFAFYTGSETRRGHAGCTVDINPSTFTIVIHGSEYPNETYVLKPKSRIFRDFPSGVVGGTIDAVDAFSWNPDRTYTVTINGTVTENPQLAIMEVGGDSPPAPQTTGTKRTTTTTEAEVQKRPRTMDEVPLLTASAASTTAGTSERRRPGPRSSDTSTADASSRRPGSHSFVAGQTSIVKVDPALDV